jgi:hypothetical protein
MTMSFAEMYFPHDCAGIAVVVMVLVGLALTPARWRDR